MDAVSEERVNDSFRVPQSQNERDAETHDIRCRGKQSAHIRTGTGCVFRNEIDTGRAGCPGHAARRGGLVPAVHFMYLDSGPVLNWDLDQSGFGSLLLHADRRPGQFQTANSRLLINPSTGQLSRELARQHQSLTTQQLLQRVGRELTRGR